MRSIDKAIISITKKIESLQENISYWEQNKNDVNSSFQKKIIFDILNMGYSELSKLKEKLYILKKYKK